MSNRSMIFPGLLAAIAMCAPVHAQTSASKPKIGVMNMQVAIANTAEGKKAITDLQKKYLPRQQELHSMQEEIQAIQDKLTKQGSTLSQDEVTRLNRDAEEKQKLLKRTAEDAQNDFDRDRDEAVNRIGQKMAQIINDYGEQNGFALIMDDGQLPIYFASKEIEVTAEVVKRYDAAHPVAEAEGPAPTPTKPPAAPTHP